MISSSGHQAKRHVQVAGLTVWIILILSSAWSMNSSYMNSFYYFPCANWLILYMNIKSSSLPSHTRVIWNPLVPWAGRTSSSPPIPMGQACCYAPLLSSLFASDERMAMEGAQFLLFVLIYGTLIQFYSTPSFRLSWCADFCFLNSHRTCIFPNSPPQFSPPPLHGPSLSDTS